VHDLRCPTCGKLLGRTSDEWVVAALKLWCRRCKVAVTPVVRKA